MAADIGVISFPQTPPIPHEQDKLTLSCFFPSFFINTCEKFASRATVPEEFGLAPILKGCLQPSEAPHVAACERRIQAERGAG